MEFSKRQVPCFKHPPLWHQATPYKSGSSIKPCKCPEHVVNIFFIRRELTPLRTFI